MRRECRKKVLLLASVASMIDQFNMINIRLLQELGYEVHTACNFEKGNTCDAARIRDLKARLDGMHVTWHQWDCPRKAVLPQACIRACRQLAGLVRRFRYAWIHCQSPAGGVLGRIAAHQAGIPVIYTAHGFHFGRGMPFWNWLLYYPVEKLLARWTDVLVTVNEEDYRFAGKHLRAGCIRELPGAGVDPDRFGSARDREQDRKEFCRRTRVPRRALVLLSVGELSRRKNHRLALRAFAGLPYTNAYYVICGQGGRERALRRQAERLGVADRVRLMGFVAEPEQMYRNADVFLFPSRQEGLPVALMEAMAAGLPCVVSDIRGNRQLVDSCGGMCVPVRSVRQFAGAAARLLADARLRSRYGRYNQQKIKKYSYVAVQENMRDIYQMMGQMTADGPERVRV